MNLPRTLYRGSCVAAFALIVGCAAEPDAAERSGAAIREPAPAQPDGAKPPADADTAAAAHEDEGDSEPAAVQHDWTAGVTRVERGEAPLSVLRAVRPARHDGFDRIVLDFGTDPVPGYAIEYIDRPVRQCGSGHAVELAGDGWLEIEATPAHAHTDEGRPTVQERSRSPGLPNLLELKLTCDFEGHVVWVAGVGSPNRYRAFELSEPSRLVVDIRH